MAGTGLVERFEGHLQSSRLLPRGSRVILALSGGLDSMVLLDLLDLLRDQWDWDLRAAHFDHRMRPESGEEAEWVRGKCAALSVPVKIGRAPLVPRGEADAREMRYRFLYRARDELGEGWLATAHQADDQAETVLFRMLRGSGLAGLSGIPARRSPRTVRPLLPFWRREIQDHAHARRLDYLSDPSNLDLKYRRNWIRLRLIPYIESRERIDLRRDLVQLADLARRATDVVRKLTEEAADELIVRRAEGRITVARTPFLAYDNNVRAHLLRTLVARVGPPPGRVGTRTALEFINTCSSGRSIDLAGGVRVCREFEHLLIERRSPVATGTDEEMEIPDCRSGNGVALIAGVRWRIRWWAGRPSDDRLHDERFACFDPAELQFPLTVRRWRPGDRIRVDVGTRKLKKVFADREVGRSRRDGYPLVADRLGVLWVVGLLKSVRARCRSDEAPFWVGIAPVE